MNLFKDHQGTDPSHQSNSWLPNTLRAGDSAPKVVSKNVQYDAIVIFGDTDLSRSRERVALALPYKAEQYILIGTQRELRALEECLIENGVQERKILVTRPSVNTMENMDRLEELLALRTDKPRIILVSHSPHMARILENYVPRMNVNADFSYLALHEPSLRRTLEHAVLGLTYDRHNGAESVISFLDHAREIVKDMI